jgi:hypothetical protein
VNGRFNFQAACRTTERFVRIPGGCAGLPEGRNGSMKRVLVFGVLLSLCLSGSLWAEGPLSGSCSGLSAFAKDLKVNSYAQAGFQWVGSNLNLPVQNEIYPAVPLQISEMDIALRDANFWAGMAGITITASEIYSLFASAGGILGRPFATVGEVPVNYGAVGASPVLEFTTTNTESWFIQTGIGLGPLLAGVYWNYFGFGLADPRSQNGPLANQSLRGDILTKTFAPFIGFALPAGGAMFSITYSPLAYSNTELSLTSSQDTLTQVRYSWNKPGDLINAMFQYNVPMSSSVSLGLWANGSWMAMRGTARLGLVNAVPELSRGKEVTATMTQYVTGGGVTLGLNF